MRERAFTLVELLIVIAVVGTITALLVPQFQTYQAHAKQSEAKNNLTLIGNLETDYAKDHQTYSGDLGELGFRETQKARYDYSVPASSEILFTALAQAKSNDVVLSGCGARDTWQIDETKHLLPVADCAAK